MVVAQYHVGGTVNLQIPGGLRSWLDLPPRRTRFVVGVTMSFGGKASPESFTLAQMEALLDGLLALMRHSVSGSQQDFVA